MERRLKQIAILLHRKENQMNDYFEKLTRTPDTKPTRMSGLFENYEELYNEVINS